MKINILAVEKQDGSFECLYIGRDGDPALDQFDALRKARGKDEASGALFVAAAVFQRPTTRKRAKFPENVGGALASADARTELPPPAAPPQAPPAGRKKKAVAPAGKPDAGDEEDTGV